MKISPSSRWGRYVQEKNIINQIAKELQKNGKNIINVTSGDPVIHGFKNDEIDDYLIKAIKDGWNMYASSSLKYEVKKTVANFEKKTEGGNYSPDDILLSPGCATALFTVNYSLLDSGDEIIAPDPSHYLGPPTSYWSCFGAKVIPCRSEEVKNWNPDVDDLRLKINKKTKAIFINNPNNPTGVIYDERILKKIVNIAGEFNLPLIGDEIYRLITLNDKKADSLSKIAKDVPTIILNGLSKLFIRTGWRFGYICLHDPEEKVQELMKAIKIANTAYGHAERGIATPIMVAAKMAFEQHPMKASIDFLNELQIRRDYVIKRITEINGMSCINPEATLYAFPKINTIPAIWKTDEEFLIDLLKEEQLMFNAGYKYGKQGFGHIRTLLLPKIEIQEEIYNRVERFLKKRTINN